LRFSLLAVSDRSTLPGGFAAWCSALAVAGVPALQVREKDLGDRELFELLTASRAAFAAPGVLLVNGRIDVALAAGADGVHLPADGLPVERLRRRFGAVVIGRSTHRVSEVERARDAGADYVTFGPVYETPEKTVFGPPVGLEALSEACARSIPVLALGGVTLDRFAELAAAGASGVAGIRMFQQRETLEQVVRAAQRVFRTE
jgi:thiamine-phosphate pyrophosphorylase